VQGQDVGTTHKRPSLTKERPKLPHIPDLGRGSRGVEAQGSFDQGGGVAGIVASSTAATAAAPARHLHTITTTTTTTITCSRLMIYLQAASTIFVMPNLLLLQFRQLP